MGKIGPGRVLPPHETVLPQKGASARFVPRSVGCPLALGLAGYELDLPADARYPMHYELRNDPLVERNTMRYFVALAVALLLNAMANLMMKFGIERFKAAGVSAAEGIWPVLLSLMTNWVLILGLACFAANVVLYTYALKGLPISVAYPIMVTLGFAIIVVVAGIYLNEHPTPKQWVGVTLILIGVWLVAWEARGQLQQDDPSRPGIVQRQ